MNIPTEIRRWVSLGCVVVVLIFAGLALSYCHERGQARKARAEASVAQATGKALDRVAAETPVIRQEQAEKQREVDSIEGSDTRLPDGYGKSLERVRRGGKSHHP